MKRFQFFRICIFVFFILLLAAPASFAKPPFVPDLPDVFMQLNPADLYPDFEYNGLTPSCAACPGCNSNFSFFVKGGTTNKVVVYFQGGGACWDSKNCLYAHTYYEEVPPVEMFADTTDKGIFDTSNPDNPFKDWYFVYIPYCTGDIHWGANDHDYIDYLGAIPGVDSWTIRHRGFVNFQVVLKWIKDNFIMPQKIFVTGSSAGGYGAIMGFPYIKEAYPWSSVYVLGDAANGVVDDYFKNTGIYNWDAQVPTWIPGFEGGYDPSMQMEYIYNTFAAYYPYSRFAQFATAWDWNQTFFYNVMLTIGKYHTSPPPLCWIPQVDEWYNYAPAWCDWHDQMLGMAHDTAAQSSNYRYYIAAGDYHTIMMSPEFYTEDSGGMLFVDWVREMIKQPFAKHGHGGKWQNMECEDCLAPVPCP